MKRTLVLLTNQFPFVLGDHSFVRHEIDALAEAFDHVIVFNYSSQDSKIVAPLPSNVSYAGNLYGMTAMDTLRAAAVPRNLKVLAQAAVAEHREGGLAGNLVPFLKSALTGMRIARDPRLRRVLEDPEVQTFVYSFWGMGAGLSLPWLPESLSCVSVRLHGYDLYKERGINGYLPFRAALFARADNIMPISETGRTYLLSTHPALDLDEKVIVSRLGSSEPLERQSCPDPANGAPARPSSHGYTVVSCSHLIPLKRVDQILLALTSLDIDRPVHWVHFGGGPLEDELRRQAAGLMQAGLTIDFSGATSNDDIHAFYAETDVDLFINVSSSEGIPVSIMEAISYNIPVLATDVGGTSEIVGPALGTGELLAAEFTPAELGSAIKGMLETPPSTYQPKDTWVRLFDAASNSRFTARIVAGKRP